MKKILIKSVIIMLAFIGFIANGASAQYLNDLPVGPNGGNAFDTKVNNQKIECKLNDNKVSFFVINSENKNAKLKVAAATATILLDYNGQQTAITRQVTITSKNKFEIEIPKSEFELNFVAIQMNFNGDIMEARYIVNKANSGSAPTK